MRSKRMLLSVWLFVILLFGTVSSVHAESPLSAKQLVLTKLKNANFNAYHDLYMTSSGNASIQLKKFDGQMITNTAQLSNLGGTKLNFDYKINSPAKQFESKYNLTINNSSYNGSLFINNNKLILSREVLSLIKFFDPGTSLEMAQLPQYLYIVDDNFAGVWGSALKLNGQSVPPAAKDLLIFIVEAIPDKYFTISLSEQKICFSVPRDDIGEVIFAVLQKVKNEKELFAGLIADTIAVDPYQNKLEIKKELVKNIDESVKSGNFPGSPEEIEQALAKLISIEKLSYEGSILPSGENKIVLDIILKDGSQSAGKLTFTCNFKSGREDLSGNYSILLTARNNREGAILNAGLKNNFKQTGAEIKSDSLLEVNVTTMDGAGKLLEVGIEGSSSARVDKNIRINIPSLTESNSIDIKQLNNKPSGIRVLLNGETVPFDVAPFLKDGKRTMVPVRNIAEALGCDVTWTDPDQINIRRGNTSISMYINKPYYMVNGKKKQLDIPPFIKDGKRTMVPVRFIAEELGCQVVYDSNTNTVLITSGK